MGLEEVTELPKGWIQDELRSICNVISGNAFKSKDFVESGTPLVKISNVQSGFYLIKNQEYLPSSYIEDTNNSFLVKPEDLLMALTRPITNGKLKICHYPKGNEIGLLNQRVCKLNFNAEIDKKYCEYHLLTNSFMKLVEVNLSETLQPNLSPKTLSTLPFVVVPLPEQKRIVEKLDSLLAQVDTIQQRLNNLPNIIKRFRQSVLAAAVSGKLTEKWRGDNECEKSIVEIKKDIKNYRYDIWVEEQEAKFLAKGKVPKNDKWKDKYKEILTELSGEEKQLPKGWVYETLEGLIYISARIGWKGLKADEYTEEGPLFLSVHGLNHGQYVDLSRAYHISKERYEESPEIQLRNEDILVCKDGAGIGKIAIIKDLTELASINSSLLLIRSGKYFLTDYLYYFLAGPEVQRIVQERMTGSAVPHLFQRDVKEFILEVPPIEEQTEIVRLVEQYSALADTLEKNLSNAKQRVDNLTQSILAKAFKGELVPQDPNDEPANKLLQRIKAARAEAEKLEKAAKKVAKASKANKAKTKPKTKGVA
ncbi:restriction endonuclease subunit S [Colwellia sp. C1TZA3]|uniref:restriction endonuclease subunit S n=1 Tax=Colwellia sp. C1TZA3 TaxID=2508879 RepID=UPI0011B9ED81|nr:restriction endonuclease subunit S [Colwellia sp. C1TZA3]TWX73802.1 restriction endonuclease [Colwellia sp. C1TZA3]